MESSEPRDFLQSSYPSEVSRKQQRPVEETLNIWSNGRRWYPFVLRSALADKLNNPEKELVAGFSCHVNVAPLGGHKQLSKEGVTRSVVVFILGFPESGLLY